MQLFRSLVILCSTVLGAPHPSPDAAMKSTVEELSQSPAKEVARTAAVFRIKDFYTGGRPQSEWNYVIFNVQVTGGAAFTECSIVTNTGPKVPTIEKTDCRNSEASWFKEWTMQDGSKLQEYVGPRNFTLDTTMSPTQPGKRRVMEASLM
ncbi:hypothetical protein CSUB01_00728 [Colletotrichum sublineola]|uniref:AA1-like domain-containing protein n=1 Tax=Colletotrichum sublineola TaxID=1173701 RepID=A0A066WXH2_COLSU|nr:hypothetical protein CSUB01_00728 [Colletotrichum sublineola]